MTELILILPILLFLAGAGICLVYVMWQGIKVQQAANLAARIQSQQRVAGGTKVPDINDVNGTQNGLGGIYGDKAPVLDPQATTAQNMTALNSASQNAPTGGVYLKYYKAIQSFFSPGEQSHLWIPPPQQGEYVDHVSVVRVFAPPKFFGFQWLSSTRADAYGGEDPLMYGLPRWGHTGSGQFAAGNSNNATFGLSNIAEPQHAPQH